MESVVDGECRHEQVVCGGEGGGDGKELGVEALKRWHILVRDTYTHTYNIYMFIHSYMAFEQFSSNYLREIRDQHVQL